MNRWRRGERISIAALAAVSCITSADAVERIILLQTTGAQAPGLPAGVTFTRFAQPQINGAGHVVFRGIVAGGDITSVNDTGLWTQTPGGFVLAAREDDPIPGASPSAVYFGEFATINAGGAFPILADNGTLSFTAIMRAGNNSAGSVALLRAGHDAPLQTIARVNSPRPDGSGNWGVGAFSLAANSTGRYVLRDSSSFLYTGNNSTALELVAKPGQVFAGRTIESIQTISAARDGTIAFISNADPAVGDERYVAFAYKPTAPTNAARLLTPGDSAPGVMPPATFLRAGNVYLSSGGDYVVSATLTGSQHGVWKGNTATPGALAKVFAPGDAAPGAPGTTFATATRQYVSRSGLMFISAELQGTSITNSNRSGVWIGTSAADLKLLARYGSPVGVGGLGAWGNISLSVNDNDQAVLGSRLLSGPQALVGYDPSLGLVPLVKSGDEIEVSPGVTKTIASLTLPGDDLLYAAGATNDGRGSPINELGEVVYRAVFSDNSQAILKTRVPIAGDATFDGIVNHADFERLYANFGKTGGRGEGDFNSDGAINFSDFQLLEKYFGRAPAALGAGVTDGDLAELAAFAQSVPEPAGAVLVMVAALLFRRRRRD